MTDAGITVETAPSDDHDETEAARGPYQLLPPLTDEELAQLEASIREHGVEDHVHVDEHGRTLDGHHRIKPESVDRVLAARA